MINEPEEVEKSLLDYRRFLEYVPTLIYRAVPYGEDVAFDGFASNDIGYDLIRGTREAVAAIMFDVLVKGRARWILNINPENDPDRPFAFQPWNRPVQGFESIPIVVCSRDAGIPIRRIRSLVRRLKHSHVPSSDLLFVEFDRERLRIADCWGHAVSWYISDRSAFTDACLLLNQCDRKILAIKLCKAVEAAMNKALSKSRFANCRVRIPTYSQEGLEAARRKYVNGEIDDNAFRDLISNERNR